jgi:hypothetical protein
MSDPLRRAPSLPSPTTKILVLLFSFPFVDVEFDTAGGVKRVDETCISMLA